MPQIKRFFVKSTSFHVLDRPFPILEHPFLFQNVLFCFKTSFSCFRTSSFFVIENVSIFFCNNFLDNMSATILFDYLIIYESLCHKNFSISPFNNMHFWIWISCHQMAKLFLFEIFGLWQPVSFRFIVQTSLTS